MTLNPSSRTGGAPVVPPARSIDHDPPDVRVGLAAPRPAVASSLCDVSARPLQAAATSGSQLTPENAGASADAEALRARGIRLLEVESANGRRYAGWIVTGNVPVRRWLAKGLGRISDFVFEDAP